MALGHKLLVIAYEIMKTRTPYYELGADYYDQLNPEKTIQRLVQRLGKLGVEVAITTEHCGSLGYRRDAERHKIARAKVPAAKRRRIAKLGAKARLDRENPS